MNAFPWRLVTLDLDGTLTRVHGWRFLAEQLGRSSEYEASEAGFRSGALDEDRHLANLLRIARGVRVSRIQELVAATPKIGAIRECVQALHQRGARVALLTHNPGYVCEWYVRAYGLDGFGGSSSRVPVDGTVGEPDPVHADKPAALARFLQRWSLPAEPTVHVGDGPADARIFPLVGGSVALNSVEPRVIRAADASLATDSLLELLPLLEAMRPHPPARPSSRGL